LLTDLSIVEQGFLTTTAAVRIHMLELWRIFMWEGIISGFKQE
jgi:hypothetical protein